MPDSHTPPPDVPGLDGMLCFAVHSTGFAFNRLYRRALRQLGLTYPQYLVMVALWEEDGVTVGRLGEQLSLDTSTLTPLLKRLESLGFLGRKRSEEDERRVMISLTEKGRDARAGAGEVTRCLVEGSGLPMEEILRITRELHGLRQRLEQAAAAQPAG